MSLTDKLAHFAYRWGLRLTQGGRYASLMAAAKDPKAAQTDALTRILQTNADTDFGKRHDFASIRAVDDFRRAVPVQDYEDLRPLIERQEASGDPCLTRDRPVYYHRTSGTLGEPKNIPITQAGLNRIRQYQRIFAYAVSRDTRALEGKIFGVTGQAIEGRMQGGTPYGSASGLLSRSQSKFVHGRYVLPTSVADIDDYDARYLAMAIYAASAPNVTAIGTANPSTLVRLVSVINREAEKVLRSITDGEFPASLAHHLSGARKPARDRTRASALAQHLKADAGLNLGAIWPDLKAVMTWTGGSCGVPLRSLTASFPSETRIVELGYVASEVQGTLNIDAARNICLPLLRDTVYEFVDRDAWERGDARFLSLHELEPGSEYYVFVTTSEGLYRYHMNDIVRVTDMVHRTPSLVFVQKGKGVTSITGEKLYEAQALQAVSDTLSKNAVAPIFFVMLADREAAQYTLFLEANTAPCGSCDDIARAIDQSLCALNIEYGGKRGSGRLAPLKVKALKPGAGEAYRADRVAAGQRDAQFKYLHLQYADECAFEFDAHVAAR